MRPQRQLCGTALIRGVAVDVVSELDFAWEDDSFSHEFGTEHCGRWAGPGQTR